MKAEEPNWWKLLVGGADGIRDGTALKKSAPGVWILKKSGALGFSLMDELADEDEGGAGGGFVNGGSVDWLKLLLTLLEIGR